MYIANLLEEFQKHGEEWIEFYLFDTDGNVIMKMIPFETDGKFIYNLKDQGGNDTNTIVFGLIKRPEKSA